jgi:hypothetical protein
MGKNLIRPELVGGATVGGVEVVSAGGAFTGTSIADNAVTTAKILNANVTLAKLAAGITPSHVVKYGGQATYAGGGTSSTVTVTGVLSTDRVQATLTGSTNVVAFKAVPSTDTITFTYASDPGADTKVDYLVYRVAA